MDRFLEQWQMGTRDLRHSTVVAPTPRERRQAIRLLARGSKAADTSLAPGREPYFVA